MGSSEPNRVIDCAVVAAALLLALKFLKPTRAAAHSGSRVSLQPRCRAADPWLGTQ